MIMPWTPRQLSCLNVRCAAYVIQEHSCPPVAQRNQLRRQPSASFLFLLLLLSWQWSAIRYRKRTTDCLCTRVAAAVVHERQVPAGMCLQHDSKQTASANEKERKGERQLL
jgi:hypothetical protein